MTADLLCLSKQKISMKTARETVLFCIKPPKQAAFFISKLGVNFHDGKTANCRRNWRKNSNAEKERGESR